MIRCLIVPAVLVAAAACTPASDTPNLGMVTATDAVCRPTPNERDVTACYLTLTASRDDRLVSASSTAAETVQIHEMSMAGGMMTMGEMVGGLPLAAGETVTLAPGGTHLMVTGVKAPLTTGSTVALTLKFDNAPSVAVTAQVGTL